MKNSIGLTGAISALANAIAGKLTVEETALLACIPVQLGDTLSAVIATKSFFNEKYSGQK